LHWALAAGLGRVFSFDMSIWAEATEASAIHRLEIRAILFIVIFSWKFWGE
jgi:hypothetical protein